MILGEAIKRSKEEGGTFAILDVSKALDTVARASIKAALEIKRLSKAIINYIMLMYEDCRTTIKTNEGTVTIELLRGVKQGDPLSSLLFNLVMEPMILKLQKETKGIEFESNNVSVVAFADDIVTMAKEKSEAVKQITIVNTYLRNLDMSLSIAKSTCLQYVPLRKSWFLCDPEITIDGIKIPEAKAEDVITYLGAKIGPWEGLISQFEKKIFLEIIMRTRKLPLKPSQMLTRHLLPRFTYGLIVSLVMVGSQSSHM